MNNKYIETGEDDFSYNKRLDHLDIVGKPISLGDIVVYVIDRGESRNLSIGKVYMMSKTGDRIYIIDKSSPDYDKDIETLREASINNSYNICHTCFRNSLNTYAIK
jgi:hypothetical protein